MDSEPKYLMSLRDRYTGVLTIQHILQNCRLGMLIESIEVLGQNSVMIMIPDSTNVECYTWISRIKRQELFDIEHADEEDDHDNGNLGS